MSGPHQGGEPTGDATRETGNRGMRMEGERSGAASGVRSAEETAPTGNVQLCVARPCKVRDIIFLRKNLIRRIYGVTLGGKQIKSRIIARLDRGECFSIRRKSHCGVIVRISGDGPELRSR